MVLPSNIRGGVEIELGQIQRRIRPQRKHGAIAQGDSSDAVCARAQALLGQQGAAHHGGAARVALRQRDLALHGLESAQPSITRRDDESPVSRLGRWRLSLRHRFRPLGGAFLRGCGLH